MKVLKPIILASALTMVVIAGCVTTDIPTPHGYSPSAQPKLRASHHWDVVATDIAARIQTSLEKLAPGARVYLLGPSAPVPFEIAMHNFVITRLVTSGVEVATKPENALQINLSTQLVTHGSTRMTVDVPLIAVAAGVMAAYNIALHENRDILSVAVLGGAALIDSQRNPSGAATKTELIVSTSVTGPNAYLVRKTDIYYVEDADLSLFTPPSATPVTPTRVYRLEGAIR